MTKLCIPNPNPNPNNNKNDMKKIKFSISSNNNTFSNILTNSLYFSYFIFFFPYLFNLISFLLPLFLTISLLLLSLTTSLIPPNSKHGFSLTAYTTLLDNSHSNSDNDSDNDDKVLAMDEFEFYKFVFDVPTIELTEANPFENVKFKENPDENFRQLDEKRVDDQCGKSFAMEQETGERKVGKKKKDGTTTTTTTTTTTVKRSESNEVKTTPKCVSLMDKKLQKDLLTSNFESMRKEKDQWRGTLACMLFEERHNNGNGNNNDEEGMDLLWETQETEINKKKDNLQEFEEKKKKKKLQRRSSSGNKTEHLMKKSEYRNDEDESEEESDDYYDNGKLCCLQGLKLSAGKMNLTMGKPNLVKISKVFTGIGWLHSQVRKLDKKRYK